MELVREVCYRALAARDARFDGRFFTGVASTGIFCRPVCPARTPAERNCQFFPTPAAALAAGFRPCLRCRPEVAPGLAVAASNSVSRAMRLIAGGALDEAPVEDLAARVGMGGRHLRRLFLEHLGATPVAVAQARRLLFAKKLLTETAMPMTEVALAAGYASLRRFNEAVQVCYGRAPSELRRDTAERPSGQGITLKLAARPPFDWRALMAFLGPRAIPALESAEPGVYRRRLPEGSVEARPLTQGCGIEARIVPVHIAVLNGLVERCRRFFDLDAAPETIHSHLAADPVLRPFLRRALPRVPGAWDPFELAVRAVLGQQVSVAGATTLAARLVALHGGTFPAAAWLAEADLTGVGLTRQRERTLRGLAAAVAAGALRWDEPRTLDDAVSRLTALPGIGPWTAHYIAMRALGEPDAFPTGDLGLLKALGVGPRELENMAERWRPWRAYAVMAIWQGASA
ncbi:MAG: DNA-3-methyladenine glycosylase 2 family protein [Acidobacteria bacterium]|nr:DNA-3-methyladenine glycosylase 2 family protein [Acidobacteriota bacterium]